MLDSTITISDKLLLDVLAQSKDATAIYDSEDLNIRFANDAMLSLWGKTRAVVGKTFEEAIPEIKGQPFTELLKNVWLTGETYIAKDAPADLVIDGLLTTSYFDFEYRAITDASGCTYCLLHTAADVTQRFKDQEEIKERSAKEQQLIEELAAGNEELIALNEEYISTNEELSIISAENRKALEQLAMAKQAAGIGVFDLDVVNDCLVWDERCKQLFGVSAQKEVTYTSDFVEGLHPDDREHTLKAVADAYNKALTAGRYNVKYRTVSTDDKQVRWVHAVGQVHFNEQDKPQRFIGTVMDITTEVDARLKLEQSESQLQDANEALFAINEEQSSINEELRATNEELADTQTELLLANIKLLESQTRLRDVLEQAPIGMCVLRGPEHIIEIANNAILNIWDRTRAEIMDKPHRKARPELEGQPVFDWLDNVYRTGKRQVNQEFKVMLRKGDGLREAIVNSIYEPLRDSEGNINGVLIVLEDITEAVKERREAAHIQEMFNLAIEAGELGAFYYDPASNLFTGNETLKRWFGLGKDEYLDLQLAVDVIADEDRNRVAEAITFALDTASGGDYDIEYTILNPQTNTTRIVKAKGKTQFDTDGIAVSLNGMLLDITERKKDEQRKNDFIAMVSHELKTPLTSIKGFTQMLQSKSLKREDDFSIKVLDKTNIQINKMTTLINGFLNVSRLESGKIHINSQVFDMSDLVKEIEEEAIATITSHNVVFAPVVKTMVNADRDKIGQVINNFISNAVKYSPGGSTINIACVTSNGKALISVKDEGMGIAAKDIDRLFERYYRVESKSMGTISGFGIGLYLCSEIIQRHNGNIGAESILSEGSTFWFKLPVCPA